MSKVIEGAVYSEECQGFTTRHVLAVPSAAGTVSTAVIRGGSEQHAWLRLWAVPIGGNTLDYSGVMLLASSRSLQ